MVKQRVIRLKRSGFSWSKILNKLKHEDDFTITRANLRLFYKRYIQSGLLSKKRTAWPTKLKDAHVQFIDRALHDNPELSAKELQRMLREEGVIVSVSRVSFICSVLLCSLYSALLPHTHHSAFTVIL